MNQVEISWLGTDTDSGVDHYLLEGNRPGTGWVPLLSTPVQTQFTLTDQTITQVRVTVYDKVWRTATNTSAIFNFGVSTSYYLLGGQRIAVKQGNTLTYLVSDQVSSTSLAMDEQGLPIANVRYNPYGQERWASGILPTDRTYTGQREDADLGLMDYNARYYDQALGRFLSPDSLIPNPGDPLAYDRYAYSNNNPINYNDPTGHRPACSSKEECFIENEAWLFYRKSIDRRAGLFGIKFSGNWVDTDKETVINAAFTLGTKLTPENNEYAFNAFKRVYRSMEMESVDYSCPEGCWGRSLSSQQIRFYEPSRGKLDPRLVIHELGHSFNAALTNAVGDIKSAYNVLAATWISDSNFPRRSDNPNGFAGAGWAQSKEITVGEEFADMFIGWVYGKWGDNLPGALRSSWMNHQMPFWVIAASFR
ncbi:MAG: RHS repeat-associated core domain-containing protein [Anaerolineaceae bacterium]|nr:RHS repeat-associated core domain-containing protein [Anaerolineaceae bacterium]